MKDARVVRSYADRARPSRAREGRLSIFHGSLLLNWKGGVCFALRSAPPRIPVPVSILQHGPSKFTNSFPNSRKNRVSSFLQQAVVRFLMTYTGMIVDVSPLFGGAPRISHFNPVMDPENSFLVWGPSSKSWINTRVDDAMIVAVIDEAGARFAAIDVESHV